MNEYYATVTRELRPGMKPEAARADIRDLMSWRPVVLDDNVITSAWVLEDRYSISWWDALIVSAARTAGCRHLISVDLEDEQTYNGVTVVNPFLHSHQEILAS